jgi:hypothetical protein
MLLQEGLVSHLMKDLAHVPLFSLHISDHAAADGSMFPKRPPLLIPQSRFLPHLCFLESGDLSCSLQLEGQIPFSKRRLARKLLELEVFLAKLHS